MRRLGWGFADQLLSSATTACWIFAVAHTASVHDFGLFALCSLVFTVLVASCRGTFGTPITLLAGHRARLSSESGFALTTTGSLGAAVAVPLALVAHTSGAGPWIVPLAVALPLVLMQDLGRFHATALARPRTACISDGVWLVASGTALVLSWTGTVTDLTTLLGLWCAGAAVGCLLILYACRTRPRARGLHGWWRERARWRLSLGLESFAGTTTTAVVQYAAALLVGVSAGAALRGAGSVFGPVSIFLQSIPLAVVPEMRLRGVSGNRDLWAFMARMALPVSLVSVVIGAAALAVPHGLGTLVLGESWSVVRPLLPVAGVEFALVAWLNAANGAFRVQGRADQLVRNRALFAGASLILGCGAALVFRSALAVQFGLALAAGLAAARARQALLRS